MAVDQRSFLQSLGSAALTATFPESIAKALSIRPNHHNRSIVDVEHIVILMQENRSFDHYSAHWVGCAALAIPGPFSAFGTSDLVPARWLAVTFCPFTRLHKISGCSSSEFSSTTGHARMTLGTRKHDRWGPSKGP